MEEERHKYTVTCTHSAAVLIDIKFSAPAYPYINNFISVNDILFVRITQG